jgi:hypothetical protein
LVNEASHSTAFGKLAASSDGTIRDQAREQGAVVSTARYGFINKVFDIYKFHAM